MKKIFIVVLSLYYTLCIEYDITITSQYYKIFSSISEVTKNQTVYFIGSSNTYFEIINFNGEIEILKGNETIGYSKEGEKSFYITNDYNSEYYVIYKIPSPFEICGISFKFSNEEINYISEIHPFEAIFLNKRTAKIKIENEESSSQLIVIQVRDQSDLLEAYFEENGYKLSSELNKTDYIPAIITDKLYFVPTVYYPKGNSTNRNLNKFTIKYYEKKKITENTTICRQDKDFIYNFFHYYLISNQSFLYYEIMFWEGVDLYSYETNYGFTKIKSNKTKYSTNKEGKIVLDSKLFISCFSIVFMDRKEKIISNRTVFNVFLLDSDFYNLTIINESPNRTTIVKYTKNNYFNLEMIFQNNDAESKCQDDSTGKYYICQFYQNNNNTGVQLYFTFIGDNVFTGYEAEIEIYFEKVIVEEHQNINMILIKISYFLLGLCLLLTLTTFCGEKNKDIYYKSLKQKFIYVYCHGMKND